MVQLYYTYKLCNKFNVLLLYNILRCNMYYIVFMYQHYWSIYKYILYIYILILIGRKYLYVVVKFNIDVSKVYK